MLRTKLATALTALFVFALPAVAQAGKIEHRGTVTGVPGTEIKFTLQKRGGELKRINHMAFRDIPYTCDQGPGGAIDADLPSFRISGNDFTRKVILEGPGIDTGSLRVAGQFSRGGNRASGQVRFSFKQPSGAKCGTDDVGWKTRRR